MEVTIADGDAASTEPLRLEYRLTEIEAKKGKAMLEKISDNLYLEHQPELDWNTGGEGRRRSAADG